MDIDTHMHICIIYLNIQGASYFCRILFSQILTINRFTTNQNKLRNSNKTNLSIEIVTAECCLITAV